MGQISVSCLRKKKDISKVFSFFTNRFVSLSKGKDYCDALAKKYEDNAEFLVLNCDGTLAAFAAFYCNDIINKTAFLSLIGVRECFEGKGFAGILLDELIAISIKNGMRTMLLEVRKNNKRAVSLYEKKGFKIIRQKDETMLVMGKDLV